MRIDTPQAVLPVHPSRPVRVQGIVGTRLEVLAGTCWITVDGDPQDRVLEAGQAWTVDTRQPVIVSALKGDARLALCAPARPIAARAWAGWGRLGRSGFGARGPASGRITVAA